MKSTSSITSDSRQSARPSILIKNAQIVNEGEISSGDLLIRHGRIERISSHIPAHADQIIDADGKALLPGMIDCHVHFREPGLTHKADMRSESRAAVAGGVTSVMEMPNTHPPAITLEKLEEKFSIAAEKMATNYSFYLGAAIHNIDEIKAIDTRRICGVKVYMGSSTGDMLVDRIQTLEELFRECPVPLTTHCEDAHTILQNEKRFKAELGDRTPFSAHPEIRSVDACYQSSKLAIQLARKYDTQLHLLHISTARELELLNDRTLRVGTPRENECFEEVSAKNITAEACIHHLFFDDTAYEEKAR